MGKFATYTIDLKNLSSAVTDFQFQLDDAFFMELEGAEVQKGNVEVDLRVKKTLASFELMFQLGGEVVVTCDRCLDEMLQPVASSDKLLVKFGTEYAEEGENMVIVPEEEGTINVAWYMYELIALAIPMKHVHEAGKCNPEMMGKLGAILRTEANDDDLDSSLATEDSFEEEHPIDPRWNDLKKILDNS